jgi:methylase of polypeptide subunit release factors
MLKCLEAEENKQLRDFFREAGYTSGALQKRFSSTEIPQLYLLELYASGIPLEPSGLTTLFRWFWIGNSVPASLAGESIPSQILDLLIKSGILVEQDNHLRSTVRISPFDKYLVISDHALRRAGTSDTNTILWPNPTTLLCYHLSLRSPGARTLDLGTGNGILALASAEHSSHVVATDLNPRARQFCLFNAALNGVPNVEFREGSAFEPVQDERFDLILANPPFFITPSVRRMYSDNAMDLDEFCRMLVRQAPQHLNQGGYCQMLAEWVEFHGEPWHERLIGWFEGLDCDVSVLALYTRSSLDYAMVRVFEDKSGMTPEAHAALIREWQSNFDEKRVASIHGGIIMLRRRAGGNWIRMQELHAIPARPFGPVLRRVFENRDALQHCVSDELLLASRPVLPASAGLHKHLALSPEGWQLASVEISSGEAIPCSITLQSQVADFIGLCNGSKTLQENADQFAAGLNADPAMIRRECCLLIRQLAERNLLAFTPEPAQTEA